MGRWSAGHWKTAVFGWLAFVFASLAIGNVVGTKEIDPQDSNVGQARRADHMLRDAGFRPNPQTEIVLVQSATSTVREPAFRAVVRDVVDAVKGSPAIENLQSPLIGKPLRLRGKRRDAQRLLERLPHFLLSFLGHEREDEVDVAHLEGLGGCLDDGTVE